MRTAAVCVALLLSAVGSATAKPSERYPARHCATISYPTPARVIAYGLTCKAAMPVGRAAMVKVQYAKPSWHQRIAGKLWRCRLYPEGAYIACRRGSIGVDIEGRPA